MVIQLDNKCASSFYFNLKGHVTPLLIDLHRLAGIKYKLSSGIAAPDTRGNLSPDSVCPGFPEGQGRVVPLCPAGARRRFNVRTRIINNKKSIFKHRWQTLSFVHIFRLCHNVHSTEYNCLTPTSVASLTSSRLGSSEGTASYGSLTNPAHTDRARL